MLAESNRKGPLTVGHSLQVNVVLGSAVVDLTEATFTSREVEINCTQLLGSITIPRPAGHDRSHRGRQRAR